jgi:hypothetical protein
VALLALQLKVTLEEVKVEPGVGLTICSGTVVGVAEGVGVGVAEGLGAR